MDYKRVTASTTTETRNLADIAKQTGNIYEAVKILGKRANQVSIEMKQDLDAKLQEFASYSDNLEEVFENHEQIEISRFYEKLPKPSLIAIDEWEHEEVYYRNPSKEKDLF
ncbi:MAG TPA: DNA-directed RNA polymerase subunit omega [Dysgonamonadaceae bacterium]|nr:DNA-directed RNA polymerase subunit omega [Dysgonamonadaceae bacterium]